MSDSSITVSCSVPTGADGWEANAEANSPDEKSAGKCSASSADSSCTIKDLKPDTEYAVTVRSFRSAKSRNYVYSDKSQIKYVKTG